MAQRKQDTSTPDAAPERDRLYAAGQWRLAWVKFKRNRVALTAAALLSALYMGALFSGFIAPYDQDHRFPTRDFVPPQGIHFLAPDGFRLRPFVYGLVKDIDPETQRLVYRQDRSVRYPIYFLERGDDHRFFGWTTDLHLFGIRAPEDEEGIFLLGTDSQGRDLFSRIFYGARISLTVGLVGVILSMVLGTVLGVTSGYFGGLVDHAIQRAIEILRSFPQIPLWMALSASIPADVDQIQRYMLITIILSFLGWTNMARTVRGQVLSLKEEPYILATRLLGGSHARIIFLHLTPGVAGYIIVRATLAIPAMILAESALSFLNLGIRPPMVSWGSLLQAGQDLPTLFYYQWQLLPALGIVLAVLAFNFVGDGVRDALDPHAVTRR